ncbi:MAG: bacteriohemerythrin [Chitinispirillia bacterium]|nr:bacteriohemerythrin [Chitinispirillia bacterium]MCL2242579.1 bacteriohemerythrin [Chitinispirillia bacterium]
MALTWAPALETGHSVIDSQHRDLINTVNGLIEACRQGHGAEKAGATLNFLVSYTKRHFHDEEMLQQQTNYPDFLHHRGLHEEFMRTAADLAAEFKQTGPTEALTAKIVKNIGDWLINHILEEDIRMAAHVKKTVAA